MSEEQPARPVEQTVNQFFATFERAQNRAAVTSVYGEPIPYGSAIVIPVASVSQLFGVGLGIGSDLNAEGQADEGLGGGGSGRVTARPVAMAEITEDGVDVHPIIDENRALVASLLFAAWTVFWATRTLIKLFK